MTRSRLLEWLHMPSVAPHGNDHELRPHSQDFSPAELHAWHRTVSAFYTTDLALIDPRATCHGDLKACAVRNAICETEVLGPGQKEPSHHCVCRPGTTGIAAGICVPAQCTRDAARVSLAANIAQKQLSAEAAQKAEIQAEELQDKLDNRPEKVWTEKGIEWYNKHFPGEGDKLTPPTVDTKLKLTRQHEDRIFESGEENVEEFEANKGGDEGGLWELKVQPKKYWTKEGKDWFLEKVNKKAKFKKDEDEITKDKMKVIKEAVKELQNDFNENAGLWTEKDPAAKKKLLEERVRRGLSRKERNLNEMFAGKLGVMPSVAIPGGSVMSGESDSASDFKIKIVVPEQTTLTGSGGPVQIGSQKLPPALLDELGKLVGHLDRAQQLKKAIVWNDVKQPSTQVGLEEDVDQGSVDDEVRENVAHFVPTPAPHGVAPGAPLESLEHTQAIPFDTLLVASLAPKSAYRIHSQGHLGCRNGDHRNRRPSRKTVAQWSAFLSLASTELL